MLLTRRQMLLQHTRQQPWGTRLKFRFDGFRYRAPKAVINDPGVVATAEKVLKAAFGDKLRPSPPVTPSEDYSEFINAGVPSMFFRIGVYEPERVAAAREGEGPQLPANHSPLFAPVPKPTIETGITAMTLAVLSAFDQKARHK